jgi:acyl-CoA thioesterase-1
MKMNLGLLVTHDGIVYDEPVPDFQMLKSPEENWMLDSMGASPRSTQGQGFINHGDKTMTYYGHWGKDGNKEIRVAMWELDRLGQFAVTRHPIEGQRLTVEGPLEGEEALKRMPCFMSCPIELPPEGANIFLNCRKLSKESELRVAVLDREFKPVEGFGLDDCEPVQSDGYRVAVRWKGGDRIKSAGPVRLRVQWGGVRFEDPIVYAAYVVAAPGTRTTTDRSKQERAFLPVKEVPSLPRVFLIGDSISMGYTVPTRELLAGKANVIRAKDNTNSSANGIRMLDTWLGDGKWDVIHFNFGLHDLKYVQDEPDPSRRRPNVPIEQYEKNLEQIVQRLQKTGAKLIWCTTTPVPPGGTSDRVAGDENLYNEAAERVMKKHGIAIDDLCAYVRPHQSEWQLPNNVHYTDDGYKALAKQVAASIEKALQK